MRRPRSCKRLGSRAKCSASSPCPRPRQEPLLFQADHHTAETGDQTPEADHQTAEADDQMMSC